MESSQRKKTTLVYEKALLIAIFSIAKYCPMLKTTLIIVFITLSLTSKAQIHKEITYQKSFIGYQYTFGDIPIRLKSMVALMYKQPKAFELIRLAKMTRNFSFSMAIGGVMIATIPFVYKEVNDELAIGIIGVGGALILASIPFYSDYKKKALKAIDLYNDHIDPTASIQFGRTRNGYGLIFSY